MSVEMPVYVPAGQEWLYGVLVEPEPRRTDTCFTFFPAGGYTFTPHRDAWGTRLARTLAEAGLPSFRFDWHGIGDSTGRVEDFALDRPFLDDATAVIGWLGQQGFKSHVIAGDCFGARTLLAGAPAIAGLKGLLLLSPPLRDHARGEGGATKAAHELSTARYLVEGLRRLRWRELADSRGRRRYLRLARHLAATKLKRSPPADPDLPWVSGGFLAEVEAAAKLGVPILIAYGTTDGELIDFNQARVGRLGRVLEANPHVQVEVFEGRVHGLIDRAVQDRVLEAVSAWATGLARAGNGGI